MESEIIFEPRLKSLQDDRIRCHLVISVDYNQFDTSGHPKLAEC